VTTPSPAPTIGKKLLPPAVTIWWVPDPNSSGGPGIANVDAPQVTEIGTAAQPVTGVVNLSCAMTAAMTLGWTDRDTDTTEGLCDNSNVKNPIRKNYDAKLTFFFDSNVAGINPPSSIYNQAIDIFKTPDPLRLGFLVQRIGPSPRVSPDPAVGDFVAVYKFFAGDPNIKNDAKAPIQMEVSFYSQGISSNGIVQLT
jgi:hypothetical protein